MNKKISGVICSLILFACGEEEMPYSPDVGCGFDDMEFGLVEPFDDPVKDKAAMPGAAALTYA